MRLRKSFFSSLPAVFVKESGVSLLEVMISLVIFSTLAAIFMGGLSTAYRIDLVSNEKYRMEALARSQIELLRASNYIDFSNPQHGDYDLLVSPEGFNIQLTVTSVDPATGQALPSGQDNGIQVITVTVSKNYSGSVNFQTYKVSK